MNLECRVSLSAREAQMCALVVLAPVHPEVPLIIYKVGCEYEEVSFSPA